MDRYLSVSRAARLVGIKRGTLQKRIQDGDISTFEGKVSVDELLRAYPQTEIEDSTMIERTRRIKEEAVGKVNRDNAEQAGIEVLAARLNELTDTVADVTAENLRLQGLFSELAIKLDQRIEHEDIARWLATQLRPVTEITEVIEPGYFAALIKVEPSGHEFFEEGNATLLEAGLRAGLALDYACSNGNCGRCKAKLISGDIIRKRDHDYVMSDAEKANGEFLMCCHSAVNDLVIEAAVASGAEDIPEQHITAKVKKIDIRDDVAMVHLKTPRTKRLRFLAGQHVALAAEGDATTDISIASCPCDDMNLHFHVPRDGSALSEQVFGDLKHGSTVEVVGPAGDFILDEKSIRSLVFIACNTGFAPVRSLIEHAMALDVAEDMHLFWITADPEDRYQHNLCRSWQDALDNFHYHPIDSSLAKDVAYEDSDDVIDMIIAALEDVNDYDFYVAGNNVITGKCQSRLLEKGVDASRLRVDSLHHD